VYIFGSKYWRIVVGSPILLKKVLLQSSLNTFSKYLYLKSNFLIPTWIIIFENVYIFYFNSDHENKNKNWE